MYSQVMKVNPAMAEQWLRTTVRNRTVRQQTVSKYADDMRNGSWDLTHQGICFNQKGELTDGQHRLHAVIRSGCTVEMMVSFDVPDSKHVDNQLTRNCFDTLYLGGVVDSDSLFRDKSVQALVGYLVKRSSPVEYRLLTHEKRYNVYLYYKDIIDKIARNVFTRAGNRGAKVVRHSTTAQVYYAILCAYAAGVDMPTLRRWNEIVRTGDPFDENGNIESWYRGPILFRNWLAERSDTRVTDGENEIVLKAEYSIDKLHRHQKVGNVIGMKVYPEIVVTKDILYGRGEK